LYCCTFLDYTRAQVLSEMLLLSGHVSMLDICHLLSVGVCGVSFFHRSSQLKYADVFQFPATLCVVFFLSFFVIVWKIAYILCALLLQLLLLLLRLISLVTAFPNLHRAIIHHVPSATNPIAAWFKTIYLNSAYP